MSATPNAGLSLHIMLITIVLSLERTRTASVPLSVYMTARNMDTYGEEAHSC